MSVIGTNISALRSANASASASAMLSTTMERLSTGKRINSAKDDAAGLAISSRMTSAVKSMAVAVRNANDGISLAQTAEGALGEVTSMLQRMKELATQSANGTLKDSDRTALQAEMTQLTSEIDNVSKTTAFNGVNLLDGTFGSVQLQTGINADEKISMSMVDTTSSTLGLAGKVEGGDAVGTGTALASSGLVINGTTIVGTGATADGLSLKNKINSYSETTGVVASVKTTITADVNSINNQSLVVGGVTISTTAAETDANSLAARINSVLRSNNNSNITASTEGGKLVLTSADGSNISLTDANGVLSNEKNAAGDTISFTSNAATVGGKLTLSAKPGFALNYTADSAAQTATGLAASGNNSAVSIGTQAGASAAMATIDAALDKISAGRGNLGAVQNRLTSTVNTLSVTATNLTDAKSRIEDADFSTESTNLAKAQILSQASTAMLAQANQSQQSVLKLLQ